MLLKKCTLHGRAGPDEVYADYLKSWLSLGFLLRERMSFREFLVSLEVSGGNMIEVGWWLWESIGGTSPAPTSSLWPLLFSALRLS